MPSIEASPSSPIPKKTFRADLCILFPDKSGVISCFKLLIGFCFFLGSVVTQFILTPPYQWKVLEGQNITFVWRYTLDSAIFVVKFVNVTGGAQIIIANNIGGSPNVVHNFQKRFTADISVTHAKITMFAVQMSDDRTKFELDITTITFASIADEVELIVQCK